RATTGADAPAAAPAAADLDPRALELFGALRALRKDLADAAGVPAYVVFPDSALRAMAALHPTSEEGLLQVPGVGPVKLERYGAVFLRLLRGLVAVAGA
ncbi:MAG: DNA helicase RecQ, partial [Deltaproteobacteria bacterium]|nr:DNA helicase RecQ [Deltaproteobacteria bacterium]